jgi:aryl-alcohol dehydrogenase-like predicted oxidoreductase
MGYRLLGRTGVSVSKLCLGNGWVSPALQAAARRR